MIILASASPRRIKMLNEAGYDPVVKPASIIENIPFPMPPETACMYLAFCKASAVADELADDKHPADVSDTDITVIAADTVVVYNGEIIGKPQNEDEAFRVLSRLRNNSHHVITGCCVIRIPSPGCRFPSARSASCFFEDTTVFFRDYSDDELRRYVKTEEPYDKAGGYAIQGTFGKYVEHIQGDFNNVVGLPLDRLTQFL